MRANNNTFVYGPQCLKTDFLDEECVTYRGGLYLPKNSNVDEDTSHEYTPMTEPWASNTYHMFNSTLSLGNELTLKSFPMAQPVASEDRWGLYGLNPQHILGVGTDSTVLSALRNAGRIASRSVGYYWGMDSIGSKDDTPGSLVFGGYDRAKTYGDGDEMDFTLGRASCQSKMMVSISGLTLNFRNGTDVSLFTSSNQERPLPACVVPQNPFIMSLNQEPYFDKLLDAIGNNYVNMSRMQGIDYKGALLHPEMPW